MGIKGITSDVNVGRCSSFSNRISNERKMTELFHLQIISKHTKINTLIESWSQANLISKNIVKKLGLETKLHPKPYPFGWLCGDAKLQVAKHCRLRFSIASSFIDEVDLDVILFDICGIVLASP